MLDYYRNLLYDDVRINEFRKAIASLINKETTVAEIGFGLGTYSFFAAMSGANRIYAIEKADVFAIGKELAHRNNLDSKIIFINDHTKNVELPEKVDYIIMEDYTPMFACKGLFQTLADSRKRFLKASGKFIPNVFQLKFALVEYPEFFNSLQPAHWKNDIAFGINWDYTTELLFNQPHYANRPGIKLLSKEIPLRTIDLTSCDDITFNFSDKISIEKPGTVHGIIGWWDCWFTPDQFFSNSPIASANTWGQMFFPIRYPIKVKAGNTLKVLFNSYQSKFTGDINYQWSLGYQNTQQDYNSFVGKIGSKEELIKFDPENPVQLNQNGKTTQFILKSIDGKKSFNDIASELAVRYPDQFNNHEQALVRIFNTISDYI
ncbi:MAG: hypothetical protein JXR87_09515 [Candidatus Marinimicrobia bacterium]|nr:hypothetical protein [Candidatus Neomarinimicrobiota bacterium]